MCILRCVNCDSHSDRTSSIPAPSPGGAFFYSATQIDCRTGAGRMPPCHRWSRRNVRRARSKGRMIRSLQTRQTPSGRPAWPTGAMPGPARAVNRRPGIDRDGEPAGIRSRRCSLLFTQFELTLSQVELPVQHGTLTPFALTVLTPLLEALELVEDGIGILVCRQIWCRKVWHSKLFHLRCTVGRRAISKMRPPLAVGPAKQCRGLGRLGHQQESQQPEPGDAPAAQPRPTCRVCPFHDHNFSETGAD